jgi:hypothetical protein
MYKSKFIILLHLDPIGKIMFLNFFQAHNFCM